MLTIENITKNFGTFRALDGVNLHVRRGTVFGLLGPNGAGKTTTFYMIVGIIKPNAGHVFIDDTDITGLPMYRRAQMGVGYLAQEASVFRQMTVADNIMSVLEFQPNLTKAEREYRLNELIDEFKLQKIRNSKGIQLSGGERRRTEIARALATNPNFLLLDEPFAGVDPIAVQDIQDMVAHLKEKNIGILITDHNVNETLRITDYAYLLYEGSVLHQGDPETMANDPDVREKYLGRDFKWQGKKETKRI